MPRETKELVVRAQQGDATAFDVLVEMYYSQVLSFIFQQLGDKSNAEDLCHETFLFALHRLPRFEYRGEGCFVGWLHKIAWNKIRAFWKKQGVERKRLVSLDELQEKDRQLKSSVLVSSEISLDEQLERSEVAEIIQRLIGRLSEANRAVVILDYKGRSDAEIADILNITLESVRQRRYRAHQKLRAFILDNPKLFDALKLFYPDVFQKFLLEE